MKAAWPQATPRGCWASSLNQREVEVRARFAGHADIAADGFSGERNMSDFNARSDLDSLNNTGQDFHFLAYPAHILLWMCDPDGECDLVSPSWATFTGRRTEDELGQGWLDRVHPEDRDVLTRTLDGAIHDRRPFQLLYRYLRSDGVYR